VGVAGSLLPTVVRGLAGLVAARHAVARLGDALAVEPTLVGGRAVLVGPRNTSAALTRRALAVVGAVRLRLASVRFVTAKSQPQVERQANPARDDRAATKSLRAPNRRRPPTNHHGPSLVEHMQNGEPLA